MATNPAPPPLNTGFPSGPLVDANGDPTPTGRMFFLSLFRRTGSEIGVDSNNPALVAALAAEVAARLLGDNTLTLNLTTEMNNRLIAEAAIRSSISGIIAAQTFVFNQGIANTSWSIYHNLGTFPSVVVVDSAGNLVEGDVFYNDTTSVTLTFTAAFAGQAYLI